MKDKNFDIDCSAYQRMSTIFSIIILTSLGFVKIDSWGIFLFLFVVLGVIKLCLLLFEKKKFARGINFNGEFLELRSGIWREPIEIPWTKIIKAEVTKSRLNIKSKEFDLNFDFYLNASASARAKERLSEEFAHRGINLR